MSIAEDTGFRPDKLAKLQKQCAPQDLDALQRRNKWLSTARPNQIPPDGDWDTLGFIAGRFFGKTRTLIEHAWYECFRTAGIRVHALAPTIGDVRRVLFEGEAGFLAKIPSGMIPKNGYNKSLHELHLTNGSAIFGFSMVEEANRIRGPACHLLIADEIAAADTPKGNLETAWKTAVLGCRLPYPDGTPARKIFATTGKPIPFLRSLVKRQGVIVVRGSSYENIKNVSPSVMKEVLAYEGTTFGKQEIYGDILDDVENAIFRREWFRLWPPNKKLPEFAFLLMSLDTAMEEEAFDPKRNKVDFSACLVLGVFNTKQCFTPQELKDMKVKSKYAAVICDFWMERLGFPELLEKARATYRTKYGKPGKFPDVVLIENKSSGISLRQSMNRFGVPTWPFDPQGQSKTMRAHASSPFIYQGMLFVPESDWTKPEFAHRKGQFRMWVEPLIEQMCAYAGEGSTEFDDGLDACLAGETKVITDAGLRRIDEIKPGERVLTHKGRWCPVSAVTARKADSYFRLKAKGLDELRLTGDHRVMAMQIEAPATSAKYCAGVDWCRADSLSVRGHYTFLRDGLFHVRSKTREAHHAMVLPRIKQASDWRLDLADFVWAESFIGSGTVSNNRARSVPVPRFLKMDQEMGWVMGLFLAEGCVHRPKERKGRSATIRWACDEQAIKRVANWCLVSLGRTVSTQRGGKVWLAALGSAVIAPLFESFGKYAAGKIVPPWVMCANHGFVSGFLDGYAHGDGHRQLRRAGQNTTQVTSVSLSLLWGIRLLLARQGRYASICVSKRGGSRKVFGTQFDCQTAYALSFADGKKNWTAVNDDDYHGLYVEGLERVEESLVVYDLQVDEDHSFVTTGGTVHNCTQAMIYLSQRGTFFVEPQQRGFPDPDEAEDRKHRDAFEAAEREKRGKHSPYGS